MSAGWIVLICVTGIALLLFLASYVIMCIACLHCRSTVKNVDLAIQHSTFRAYAAEITAGREWFDKQPSEEVTTLSYDGLRLYGRYLPCENARGTILLFHGWRSLPMIDFSCAVEFYHSLGLNLLLVDERSHGKSEGRYITYGVRERHDVHSWIAWHNKRFGAEVPLLLAGLSMGASTVLMACGEPFPENVKGVLADCGFTSPYEIIRKVVRDAHFPAGLLMPLLGMQARLFAGFGLKEYSTTEAMKHMTLPVLFVHGTADTFVPYEMTKRSYEACISKDKRLLLVPEAGHGQSYLIKKEEYQNMVAEFVNLSLAERHGL